MPRSQMWGLICRAGSCDVSTQDPGFRDQRALVKRDQINGNTRRGNNQVPV